MKGKFILLVVCLLSLSLTAQEKLSQSKKTSLVKIYSITAAEAFELYHTNLYKVKDKLFHTLVHTISKNEMEPYLPDGNYLFVSAEGNKLNYELLSVGDVYLKLINNQKDLALVLHQAKGTLIENADVELDGKKLTYDPSSRSYRLNNHKKSGNIRVVFGNTTYYFPLKEPYRYRQNIFRKAASSFPLKYISRLFHSMKSGRYRPDYFHHPTAYENKFHGFLTTNKPIYKPGDTVKLKAFVMNKRGKGLNDKLLVRLSSSDLTIDTIIATVSPYRDGGYLLDFALNDDLDLDLDEEYLITLEELRSRKYDLDNYEGDLEDNDLASLRKVVMRGKFHYEEYELKTIQFTARSDKKEHSRGEEVSVFLKAVDENELPVYDGRVELTMHRRDAREFYADSVFLADTLWGHSMSLETVGETRVVIPDSVFPQASFSYEIQAVLLSSNNERNFKSLYGKYNNAHEKISFEPERDSVRVLKIESGKSKTAAAVMYRYGQHDKLIDSVFLQLPAMVITNPYIEFYKVRSGQTQGIYQPKKEKVFVSVRSTRTHDSLFIEMDNPGNLPAWYTLFAGRRVVKRGFDSTLSLALKTTTSDHYFLSLQYVYGNEVHNEEYTFPYHDKLLKLAIHAPGVVYPGQDTEIEIEVKDDKGNPVENADVTAFAFTKKFSDAKLPDIPYLGKFYPGRKKITDFQLLNKEWRRVVKLEWLKWSRQLGLDSMTYYHFLYPDSIYVNTEEVKDSLTQISPFVVIDGELQPIHTLFIDEKPYYFSHSFQNTRYSFFIDSGRHSFKIRTHDRMISLKNFQVHKGVKTILSINGDTTNKSVIIQKMPLVYTDAEKALLTRYSIMVEHPSTERITYIKQDGRILLLPSSYSYNQQYKLLLGPLMPRGAWMNVHGKHEQFFEPEGGYSFRIEPGFVRQKQENFSKKFSGFLSRNVPPLIFTQPALTEDEIDSLWNDYLDTRSANTELFRIEIPGRTIMGQLRIGSGNNENKIFARNLFLLKYEDTDFMKVYKGSETNLGSLEPGLYRLFILLKGEDYILMDSIRVKPGGINYYRLKTFPVIKNDSTSRNIWEIIQNRERIGSQPEKYDIEQINNSLQSRFSDMSTWTNNLQGKITDKDGNPIPYVSVHIKGTKVGAFSDASGNYSIKIPGNGTLVFSTVGFMPVEKKIGDGNFDIRLEQAQSSMDEVVVTAYGIRKRKMALTGSVSTVSAQSINRRQMFSVSNVLQGRVSGLVISDGGGVPGTGGYISIRGIRTISESGSPLYVINGIPYEGEVSQMSIADIESVTVLKDAAATALYGARAANGVVLITTKKSIQGSPAVEGVSSENSLRNNFSDHAYWQPSLRTGKNGKVKFHAVFPDDITGWRNFAYAVSGKKQTGFTETMTRSFKPISANLSLPRFIVEGDSVHLIAKSQNYTADSIRLRRTISMNEENLEEGYISFYTSFIDTVVLKVRATDSLKLKMQLEKTDGYYDGEERKIPVFRQGVIETKGIFTVLENDSSFIVQPDPELGNITVHAEASVLPVLLDETEKLKNYEYLCNEQLASKLKGLLARQRIYQYLKKEFKERGLVEDLISALQKNRKGNLWGWWAGNDPLPWISLHVTEALLQAEKQGYKILLDKTFLRSYLVYQLETYKLRNQLHLLELAFQLEAQIDYKKYLDTLQNQNRSMPLYDHLRITSLKQKTGQAVYLDSLVSKRKQTMFGNWYWGEENYLLFDNSIQNTVLMYRILKAAGNHDNALKKIRNYFLEKRKDGQWRNTYESSLVLETILPELLSGGEPKPAVLKINNETITRFPFTGKYNGNEIIAIKKEGDMPIYFTAYQQSWKKNPLKMSNGFEVRTFFVLNNDSVALLKAGVPVRMQVEVKVLADADYVMIEIPIPASCSYEKKSQEWRNNEVHREYFTNKVSVFCSSLKQGSYTFNIELLPRYSGRFHLNPARAEMMYFPVFYGREGIKKIDVK